MFGNATRVRNIRARRPRSAGRPAGDIEESLRRLFFMTFPIHDSSRYLWRRGQLYAPRDAIAAHAFTPYFAPAVAHGGMHLMVPPPPGSRDISKRTLRFRLRFSSESFGYGGLDCPELVTSHLVRELPGNWRT